MRILAIGSYYWPDVTGIAPFTTGRCEYLASQGHEVTVCTAFPYYPEWRIDPGYHGKLWSREKRNGVDILRTWLYVPRVVTSVRRVLHEASFIATSLIGALGQRRPHLIFITSPPLGLALSAIFLARIWKVPYVFHVEDLQPDAAVDLGMLADGKMIRALYAIEKLAYRKASLVSTITESMRERIISKGIAAEKVALFSQWADPPLFQIPLTGGGQDFRRAHELKDDFLVLHLGNMGVKQGLEVILGAAMRCQDDQSLRFAMAGDGAVRRSLEESARQMNLNGNLRFLGMYKGEPLHDLLAASDVCLVTQKRSVADIVFPSKLLTLLSAGRPVVGSISDNCEAARVLKKSGAGMLVEPENPDALASILKSLRSNPRQRLTMAEKGRAFARANWDHDRILADMENRFRELAPSQAAPFAESGHAAAANRPHI